MEKIFVGTAVVAFVIMLLSLMWPKKKQHKKVEPVIVSNALPQIKQPMSMPTISENLDERQLARQLFSVLRDK